MLRFVFFWETKYILFPKTPYFVSQTVIMFPKSLIMFPKNKKNLFILFPKPTFVSQNRFLFPKMYFVSLFGKHNKRLGNKISFFWETKYFWETKFGKQNKPPLKRELKIFYTRLHTISIEEFAQKCFYVEICVQLILGIIAKKYLCE